jgi:ABC-type molybdenum transport system ATPase subunit/photorepair protein PhrA
LFALTFTSFPMIKFDLSKTNFAKQTIAFSKDFADFAGLGGVWAAALSVIAAAAFHLLAIAGSAVQLSESLQHFAKSVPAHADAQRLERDLAVAGASSMVRATGAITPLCLARAVLRRPWLFILDEATSALDVATEGKILKRIVNLDPRPTIVMIAHREQSLVYCDRMLRFQNG